MHEPSLLLRLAMYHFPGGDGYLCGLLLFCLAQLGLIFNRHDRWRRPLTIASRIGLIWSFVLPSPTPRWLLVLFSVSLLWLCLADWRSKSANDPVIRSPRLQRVRWLSWLAVVCAFAILLCELPYRFSPSVDVSSQRLCVVGDSVTAGLNDGEDTWPQRLARRSHWQITDASQPGATLKSARQQVELLDTEPSVLLLEIGGNDMLESLPLAQFEHNLEQLLIAAHKPGRTVLMFELPLPPLAFRYGETQRRLASKYEVALLPKRLLIGVLTSSGATVDGIHLAPNGHERMAKLVEKLLNIDGASRQEAGSYRHVGPR
ncbi:MAG: hypothetical protein H7062_01990 [Candidatus Saccharimonas sp.]|nr:hypothetical protein [Planctomycetaceae bacterium]